MKKFFRTSLWILLALLAAGTFFFLWQNSRPRHDRYESVVPAFDTIERTTVLTGTIEPRDEIQIKPQISGIIAEIAVEPGDQVRTGDIIARIKVVPEASQLSSAQNRLSVATIELDEKETAFRRDSVLYHRQVISRQEFETSLNARARALEEVAAATDALAIVREGVSRYNATESNTLVRATVDGLVLDVPVQVGSSVIQANTLNDGTTVAVIADMSDLIFRGKVDETEVGMLRAGMPLTITVGAIPELEAHSQIEYIAPKGDNSSGANTFEIKAAIPAENTAGMRSGYSANATIALASSGRVLTLPEGVIEFAGDSAFVQILVDSLAEPRKYRRQAVTTGLSDGINIEITAGIDSTVIVRGKKTVE